MFFCWLNKFDKSTFVPFFQIQSFQLETFLSSPPKNIAFHQNVFSTWCLTSFWFVAVFGPSLVAWLNYSKKNWLWRKHKSCSEFSSLPFLFTDVNMLVLPFQGIAFTIRLPNKYLCPSQPWQKTSFHPTFKDQISAQIQDCWCSIRRGLDMGHKGRICSVGWLRTFLRPLRCKLRFVSEILLGGTVSTAVFRKLVQKTFAINFGFMTSWD